MPYIGKIPAIGNYTVLDALTATTTDTYALTKNSVAVFPQTPANCIVSLNGVIQAPFDSYTISGSNIVFASALTGSDSIDFITVLGDVLNVGTVSDGTITTAKLANTSVTPAKMDLSQNYTFTGAVSGHNYPAFEAYLSSDQTVSSGVQTKIQFNTEDLDTDNCYDNTTNYRFTPNVAGKYYVYGSVRCNSSGANLVELATVFIYKNGSEYKESGFDIRESSGGAVNNMSPAVSGIVDMNGSSDYVELFGRNLNSTIFKGDSDRRSYFGAYRIGS